MTTETTIDQYGFGRVAIPDARDGLYPMRAVLGPSRVRTGSKHWPNEFPPLNQGSEGTCVGHGWKHHLLTEPLVQAGPAEEPLATSIYDRATEIDEWKGNERDRTFGTSTRAGAEVLRELGLMAEYRHAQSLDDILDWLADRGPVVIGCNWYYGMSYQPFSGDGFLAPIGRLIGGHCVCLTGADFDAQFVVVRNSWGPWWGPQGNGTGRLRFADLERLIFAEGGDAIAGLEVALGPTPPPTPPEPPAPPTINPQFPYQETRPARYDADRDMWIYEFAVQRHTGGWDD